jgi:F-type H+-transporting ATPase subunit a
VTPVLGLEFPPISHLIVWPTFGPGLNKPALIWIGSAVATTVFFLVAGSKKQYVPRGVQALAESGVDFVRNQIIMPTMGPDGLGYLPLLVTMFFFIFFSNITEIIPGLQFPANARMAVPMFLALMVWLIFIIVGIVKQGPLHYVKNSVVPPNVPKFLLVLVVPIELISVFVVRPFSQMVRLLANMLAGHLILTTFGIICAAAWALKVTVVIVPFSFVLLVGLTGFEVLVSFLQAFIFTILTGVYIGSSMHPHH